MPTVRQLRVACIVADYFITQGLQFEKASSAFQKHVAYVAVDN